MKYHTVIINLLKHLVKNKLTPWETEAFQNAVQRSPEEALKTATIRLETLLRIYYLRHGFYSMDSYLLHYLNTLGFMSLEELKNGGDVSLVHDRKDLLLLCALGLREQGQYFYLVRTVFWLLRNSMSKGDLALLCQYAQEPTPDKDALHRPQELDSEYPLDIVNISGDPQKHRVGYLVKGPNNLAPED